MKIEIENLSTMMEVRIFKFIVSKSDFLASKEVYLWNIGLMGVMFTMGILKSDRAPSTKAITKNNIRSPITHKDSSICTL